MAADETVLVSPVINGISKQSFGVDRQQLSHVGIVKLEDLSFNWGMMPDSVRGKQAKHDPVK